MTFLDILGFRELVSRGEPLEIGRAIGLLGRFAGMPATGNERDDDDDDVVSFNFSDCVVRVRHYDGEYATGALHQEVLALVHAQAELIHQGVMVRGGVTTGDVLAEAGVVFGPALNRAYELESEYATFPRIVIGPEAFAALRSDVRLVSEHHNLIDEIHYTRNLLRRGDDGLWYVDYLAAIRDELDVPETYVDLLDEHRALILERAIHHAHSPRVMHKLGWLARYHNDVCERSESDSTALIGSSDLIGFEELAERSPYDDD